MISILNNDDNPSFAVRPPPVRSLTYHHHHHHRSSSSSSFSPPSLLKSPYSTSFSRSHSHSHAHSHAHAHTHTHHSYSTHSSSSAHSSSPSSPQSERAEHSDRDLSPLAPAPRRPASLRANSSASSVHSTSSLTSASTMDGTSPITPGYQYEAFPSGPLVPLYEATMESDSAYPPLPEDLSLEATQYTQAQHPQQQQPKMTLAQQLTAYSPIIDQSLIAPVMSSQPPPPQQHHQQIPPPPVMDMPKPVSKPTATPGKKNKYPCPYAQSHNCDATFTTSGHAARHGKKHTGEKGVLCPICNKAFTRKDNMKQHERTHKLSTSATQASKEDSRKRKIRRQQSMSAKGRDSPSSSTSDFAAMPADQLASLAAATAAPIATQSIPPPPQNSMSAYPPLDDFQPASHNASYEHYPAYGGGGLDTLAMAASNVSSSPEQKEYA